MDTVRVNTTFAKILEFQDQVDARGETHFFSVSLCDLSPGIQDKDFVRLVDPDNVEKIGRAIVTDEGDEIYVEVRFRYQ